MVALKSPKPLITAFYKQWIALKTNKNPRLPAIACDLESGGCSFPSSSFNLYFPSLSISAYHFQRLSEVSIVA